jgi:hypothetical protein
MHSNIAIYLCVAWLSCFAHSSLAEADETNAPASAPSPVGAASTSSPTVLLDDLTLGDDGSEQMHKLQAEESEVGKGAFDLPFRRPSSSRRLRWMGGRCV